MSKPAIIGIALSALLAVPLLSYGTLSPCGILKKEFKAQILEKARYTKSGWDALGSVVGIGMVDGMVDAIGPLQCMWGYVRLKFIGDLNIAADDATKEKKATEALPRGWQVITNKSSMDDSTNVYIAIFADNPVKGWLTEDTPSLILRCVEKKTNAYFSTGMQLETSDDRIITRIRFDQEKPSVYEFSKSTNGQSMFAIHPINLIKKILNYQVLTLEFTPFRSGPATATFQVRGLEAVLGELRTACRW